MARLSGTDRKTVRRYVDRARACGLDWDGDAGQLTDEVVAVVIAGVRPSRPNGKSEAWETVAGQHEQIKAWLDAGLTVTKVHTLLGRRGVVVSYRTLHRYPTTELGFGARQATVRVADCEPGAETTGWTLISSPRQYRFHRVRVHAGIEPAPDQLTGNAVTPWRPVRAGPGRPWGESRSGCRTPRPAMV